jgi:mono/diheme cytochrome c family protein
VKKVIRRVLAAISLLLLLAVAGVLLKFYVLSPRSRAPQAMTAQATPESLARGKYLVNNVAACIGCHSPVQEDKPGDPPVDGRIGAGRDFGDWGPKVPFHLRAPNLTPDKETGIGNFTDGEVIRAIREGIGKDGRALFPQMPYVTYAQTLSDEDALAIVAYLRTLPPIKNDPGRTDIKFPVSMFIRGVPKPLEGSPPKAPAPTDKLARGKWLLDVCSCHDCHDSVDSKMQKLGGKGVAGGMCFALTNGRVNTIAPNITPDKATGIGAYSDDDLRRVFDEGKGKSGRFLYTMPWSYYGGMTKDDKEALIAALREVPAVVNPVAPSEIK